MARRTAAQTDPVAPEIIDAAMVAAWLPDEPEDAHKGSLGRALVVAGSVQYTGAAFLTAAGAYRAGAGLVTVALPGSIHGVVAGLVPEATFLVLSEDLGVVAKPAAAVVHDAWGGYEAMALGPGLTRQRSAREFVRALLAPGVDHRGPALGFDAMRATAVAADDARPPDCWVVDADGLQLVAELPEWPALLPAGSVLTPHPGEMARIWKDSGERVPTARAAAAAWGHVVVLKGARTVVAAPDGRTLVSPFANPTLATAGTGDVLTGAVVGLLAGGVAPFEAAAAAVYVHGLAGELAGEAVGRRGATARDVLAQVSRALDAVVDGRG